MHGLCLRVWIL